MRHPIGVFIRHGRVLGRQERLPWAAKDLFNAGAVVVGDQVWLLVRGEDAVGTSRIGLAVSDDGLAFELAPEPVLFPADDEWRVWEAHGCEDPRVVARPEGGYVCTYTAFDGKTARLFVATSDDLRSWTKHGPAFGGTNYVTRWSKSGAIVCSPTGVAATVGGRFFMVWGERVMFGATSEDLLAWQPVEFDPDADRYLTGATAAWRVHNVPGRRALTPIMAPRRHRFDAGLVEPGPPPILTERGIEVIYNGASAAGYQPGVAVLDPHDPTAVLARATEPLLLLTPDETTGQVPDVCFAQGLVHHRDRWLLYYGMGDSSVGCASFDSAPGTDLRPQP